MITIVDNAPLAMQTAYLPRIRAVLLGALEAAGARHRELFADLSNSSLSTPHTFFSPADGLLENLRLVESLIFAAALNRREPTTAPVSSAVNPPPRAPSAAAPAPATA